MDLWFVKNVINYAMGVQKMKIIVLNVKEVIE